MKTQDALIAAFSQHMAHQGEEQHIADDEPIATLFASEHIKMDYSRGRVRLPVVGWLDFSGKLSKKLKVDWAAVINNAQGNDHNQLTLILGKGNPFDPEVARASGLPTKGSDVIAVPFGITG